jgi:hypothetical protein
MKDEHISPVMAMLCAALCCAAVLVNRRTQFDELGGVCRVDLIRVVCALSSNQNVMSEKLRCFVASFRTRGSCRSLLQDTGCKRRSYPRPDYLGQDSFIKAQHADLHRALSELGAVNPGLLLVRSLDSG